MVGVLECIPYLFFFVFHKRHMLLFTLFRSLVERSEYKAVTLFAVLKWLE
jgi:hypothetical protein